MSSPIAPVGVPDKSVAYRQFQWGSIVGEVVEYVDFKAVSHN